MQIGVRRADTEIIPEGDNGLSYLGGIEGAWAFNHKWALFWDINTSNHDSWEICAETPNCNSPTPFSHQKVLTVGVERRYHPGPKGGQWFLGLGTGAIDVEWTGVQVHHGILSLNAGRRSPLGPGVLRWTLRIETGIGSRTDASFHGALDQAWLTNVVLAVGWGFDFGRGFKQSAPWSPVPASPAAATARVAGR